MADKDQTTKDLTHSPQTSNLEAQTTKNSLDQIDELINKDEDAEESKMDNVQEQGLILYSAIRKGNQDAVKRRRRIMARSAQHERHHLEEMSPKIDSAQEFSDQVYGRNKGLALSSHHQTTNLQVRKKIEFAKTYGDIYRSDEGEDSGNKGFAELETFEGEKLTLTGYCGDIEEETEKESKDDDSDEEGFIGDERIEESDPEFKELLQTSESGTEQEQEKVSEEGFVMKKKSLLERIADSSSNDLEQEEASDGAGSILTNIEGLEEEMRKLNIKSGSNDESCQLKKEEGDVKLTNEAEKDQHRPKKSLMEWLRGHVELDEDWETVKEIKVEAVKLATELSHMLFNLMFSLPKINLVDTMFQVFFYSLKYQFKDENSKVIHRILVLLEFADEEVKKLEKVDTLEEYSDTNQDDEFLGSELRERLFKRSQVDDLIPQFLNPILCLENTLLREGEPDQGILVKDLLSVLKDELKECDKKLKKIASRIDELKAEYRGILGPENQHVYERIKSKINELWNQGFDSEEDEDQ